MSAVLFQTMPPLSLEEYGQLEASILTDGVQVPIIVDENGVVIDGHHRKRIAEQHGLHCPREVRSMLTDAQKTSLSIQLNIARRQLNREQKRAIIEAAVKAQPEKSNREHARALGADHKTVGTVRDSLEESGEIPHFGLREDPRTGNLSQVASRPAAELVQSHPDLSTQFEYEDMTIDAITGEVVEPIKVSEQTVTAKGKTTTAPNGKEYARPEPKAPRRRPITDQARDLGWDIRKQAEKLQRLINDDRFARNKEEVTALLRGHLMFTVEVCQDLLDDLTSEGTEE